MRARALLDQATRNPAIRAGVVYGLIGGVVSLVLTILLIAEGTSASPGPLRSGAGVSGLVSFVALALSIYSFLIYVFAGRIAARQMGTLSSGAIAGLVTGVVASVFSVIANVIQFIVAPATMDTVTQIATFGGALTGAALVLAEIIGTVLSLGLGAGLGALGALLGRRAYRRQAASSAP